MLEFVVFFDHLIWIVNVLHFDVFSMEEEEEEGLILSSNLLK